MTLNNSICFYYMPTYRASNPNIANIKFVNL